MSSESATVTTRGSRLFLNLLNLSIVQYSTEPTVYQYYVLKHTTFHWFSCYADSVNKSLFPSVCFFPSWKPRLPVDWRLLVEEGIANIAKLEDSFSPQKVVTMFCVFEKVWFFWVFASQPTVHSGRVSRGTVFGYGCWQYCQVTGYTWHGIWVTWHTSCDTVCDKYNFQDRIQIQI